MTRSRLSGSLLGFSFSAPIPPLTFLCGKARVARLGDGGVEDVEDAGVLVLAREAFEARVHFARILLSKLSDGVDAQSIEIAEHRGTDRDEVTELARLDHWSTFRCSLYFRHRLRHTLAHSECFAQEVSYWSSWSDDEGLREEGLPRESVRAHPSQTTRRMGHPQFTPLAGQH